MAKRKRLSGPNPDYLPKGGLETEAMFPAYADGGYLRPAPPIAEVAGEAAATAALDEVSSAWETARLNGRLVLELPLSDVQLDYLVRDRVAEDDDEMRSLMASIAARGQQTPIEVADLGDGTFGLISGWRRCRALDRLLEDTGEDRFGTVLALLRRPEESSDAYLAMVEENEIRVGLSYFERARIVAKSVDQGVFVTQRDALQALFANASRAKRSKIGTFQSIVRALDGHLRFPEAIGERLGLQLAKALDGDGEFASRIITDLERAAPTSAEAEQAILQAALAPAPVSAQKQSLTGGLETDIAVSDRSETVQLRPGLQVQTRVDGSLVIRGAAVDADMRDALIGWLEQNF
ncbi:ParB/RepB/Spo0J family partition protein [Shimia biformata]|uniref:ParB/RepB/Spo0J family partition protein n=1 Tax=Shimia biformata TaxID=1294299 RepID=UPI0019514852|nr:ParB N-terminal domain-containing protein [Shimia biformata]